MQVDFKSHCFIKQILIVGLFLSLKQIMWKKIRQMHSHYSPDVFSETSKDISINEALPCREIVIYFLFIRGISA